MKDLTENATFEKARRWSLVTAVSAIILLVLLYVLEAWGAIEFGGYDDWSWEITTTFWGKLQESLSIVAGFGFAVVLLILFVLPRKKN